jgi:hypothetical protein
VEIIEIEKIKDDLLKERVIEKLFAGSLSIPANQTTPVEAIGYIVDQGYDAIIVSVGCTQDVNSKLFLKVKDKDVYDNGLNTAGLRGTTEETLLLVPAESGDKVWLGFTNSGTSAITMNWRLRIRLFEVKK